MVIIASLYSCREDVNEVRNLETLSKTVFKKLDKDKKIDIISYDKIEKINKNFSGSFLQTNSRVTLEELNPEYYDEQLEENLAQDYLPVTSNGKEIYNNLIQSVIESQEFKYLSYEEQNSILNFDDSQYAQVGIIYSILNEFNSYNNVDASRISADEFMNCAGAALGIGEIYGLVTNTSALMSAQTAVVAFRLIAKRACLWVGVALAVYNFV